MEQPQRASTIELWQRWMEYQRLEGVAPQTLANRYQTIGNLLKHFDAKSTGRSSKRDSFTLDEVQRILQTFRLHPLYFRYHDFILMLLTFGLRPSEAIGLP